MSVLNDTKWDKLNCLCLDVFPMIHAYNALMTLLTCKSATCFNYWHGGSNFTLAHITHCVAALLLWLMLLTWWQHFYFGILLTWCQHFYFGSYYSLGASTFTLAHITHWEPALLLWLILLTGSQHFYFGSYYSLVTSTFTLAHITHWVAALLLWLILLTGW